MLSPFCVTTVLRRAICSALKVASVAPLVKVKPCASNLATSVSPVLLTVKTPFSTRTLAPSKAPKRAMPSLRTVTALPILSAVELKLAVPFSFLTVNAPPDVMLPSTVKAVKFALPERSTRATTLLMLTSCADVSLLPARVKVPAVKLVFRSSPDVFT